MRSRYALEVQRYMWHTVCEGNHNNYGMQEEKAVLLPFHSLTFPSIAHSASEGNGEKLGLISAQFHERHVFPQRQNTYLLVLSDH